MEKEEWNLSNVARGKLNIERERERERERSNFGEGEAREK